MQDITIEILSLPFIVYTTLIAGIIFLALTIRNDMYSSNRAVNGHYKYVYGERAKVSKSIYVAGSWVLRDQLKKKMEDLRTLGFTITSEWPNFEDKLDNPDDYAECSRIDIDGVASADTVLAFMTDSKYPYRGTFTEIGCAIGCGRRIIIVCDGACSHKSPNERAANKSDGRMSDKFDLNFSHYCMGNVFFWDPRIEHVTTFEDAIKLLRGEKVESPYGPFYSGAISERLYKNTESMEKPTIAVNQQSGAQSSPDDKIVLTTDDVQITDNDNTTDVHHTQTASDE